MLFWVPCACMATPVEDCSINLWKTLTFTCMQKNCNFFLEILQRFCKLFGLLWVCLAKSIKKDITNLQKTLMFTIMQKSTSSLTSFLTYWKDIGYLLFWVPYAYLAMPITYIINLLKTLIFICTKTQLHPSLLSWDIIKVLQTCYFGYFGYDWPCPLKLTRSPFRKICYLSACKNQLHPSLVSWDIAKILKTQKQWYQLIENLDIYLHGLYTLKNYDYKRYYTLKNPAI